MDQSLSRASAYQKRNRTTHSWYGDWSSAGCIMSQSLPSARTLEEHMRNARKAMSVSSSFYQPRPSTASVVESGHSTPASTPCVPRVGNGAFKASYVIKRGTKPPPPPTSSASSPGATTAVKIPHAIDPITNGRPSNSYSYDGGFFVTANNANKDFFVIDPEWVSEDETIKKLPPGKKGGKGAAAAANGDKPATTRAPAAAAAAAPPPRAMKSYKRSKSAPPSKHRQNPITWQY